MALFLVPIADNTLIFFSKIRKKTCSTRNILKIISWQNDNFQTTICMTFEVISRILRVCPQYITFDSN